MTFGSPTPANSAGLIIFDLDGTLVDQEAAVRRWVDEFTRAHGVDASLQSWIVGELTARTPKDQAFARIAAQTTASADPASLWAGYRRRMPELVECFSGIPDALSALREAGWILGIATNGMADNQVGKIRRTGLDKLVDGWVVSSEAGVRKPDPALLAVLAERLGTPLEGWMVGDGLESDVQAGRRAGIRTAWITDETGPADAADLMVPDVVAFAAAIRA